MARMVIEAEARWEYWLFCQRNWAYRSRIAASTGRTMSSWEKTPETLFSALYRPQRRAEDQPFPASRVIAASIMERLTQ